jgi:hypothetical protein
MIDFIFPDEGVARIHGLEHLRSIDLNCRTHIRAQFVFYGVGDVGDVRTAQEEAGIPTVKYNHTTIFSATADTCLSCYYEYAGQRTKYSHAHGLKQEPMR